MIYYLVSQFNKHVAYCKYILIFHDLYGSVAPWFLTLALNGDGV
jgi:hypothetical protein